MKPLLLLLTLCSPLSAQVYYYVPTQCQSCPGNSCPTCPQYGYDDGWRPNRPQQRPPQQEYTPPVGSQGTPQFKPNPPQSPPAQPPPVTQPNVVPAGNGWSEWKIEIEGRLTDCENRKPVDGKDGEPGPQGERGYQGLQGPTGPPGEPGQGITEADRDALILIVQNNVKQEFNQRLTKIEAEQAKPTKPIWIRFNPGESFVPVYQGQEIDMSLHRLQGN